VFSFNFCALNLRVISTSFYVLKLIFERVQIVDLQKQKVFVDELLSIGNYNFHSKGHRPVADEDWEEEQKRLDRQWYSIDEGFDESQNPFTGMSEEYTQRKEKEMEQKRKKKMSARQRQIQKVNSYLTEFRLFVKS
jgi:hypothetical protein